MSSSSEKDESSNDGYASMEDESEDRVQSIREELGHIPFEDLEKLKEKVGITEYNEAIFGSKNEKVHKKKSEPVVTELFAENRKKKDSRPMELSSKKRVSKLRNVVLNPKQNSRDPRFDDRSGNLNKELFKKSYAFLDEVKDKEKKEVRQLLKKEKNVEKKAALHKLLQRMEQNEMIEKQADDRLAKEREMKKKEKDAIKQGKKPFYLKESEKKKLELVDKYKELKDTGKLEKYLSKRRKRNATKERKFLPYKRDQDV